jgi:hypothetical protein
MLFKEAFPILPGLGLVVNARLLATYLIGDIGGTLPGAASRGLT